ncbi:MAG TPA: hypothetical protein DDX51_06750 [Clostridiales bacterium]|nr:hypothetical protein [Clostridiales bacterium]
MEASDVVSSLLSDPDAVEKLSGLASELMGGGAPPPPPPMPPVSPQPMPPMSGLSMKTGGKRMQLLTALKPFLSSHTCSQIDHAVHILSMARMARTAATQFVTPYRDKEE